MIEKAATIRYLIVEDNKLDELALRSMILEHSQFQYIATAHNALEAISYINSTAPELVFMDIDIPGGSGIELLRLLKDKIPATVFVTSHPEYAIDGFELCAFDYILKPVTEERLQQSVSRIEDYRQMKQKAEAYDVLFEKEMLVFRTGHDQVRLPQQEVIYLEAMQDYTKVVAKQKKYMVNMPLSGFLSHVDENVFLRIHRSYAVPLKRIREIKNNNVVCEDTLLPIGKTYRSAVAKLKL